MKLAIIHNEKGFQKVDEQIKTHRDDIETTGYTTVANMIDNASVRRIRFDRVLLFSNTIQGSYQKDLSMLDEYLKINSEGTVLVTVNKMGTNSDMEEYFNKKMNYANYCFVNAKGNIKELMDFTLTDIQTLRANYCNYSVDALLESTVVIGEREAQIKKNEDERRRQEEAKKKEEQKKNSFFGKLFGFKHTEKPKNPDKNQKSDKNSEPDESKSNSVMTVDELIRQENEKFGKNSAASPYRTVSEVQKSYDTEVKKRIAEQKKSEANKNEASSTKAQNKVQNLNSRNTDTQNNSDINSGFSGDGNLSKNSDTSVSGIPDDSLFISDEEEETSGKNKNILRVNSEIEPEMFVGKDEKEYQKEVQEANSRVREVIVTKEGKESVASAIVKGKLKKSIIFTGDRCSGVTLSALQLADFLTDTVKVLYVDFDVDNHGVLNYLDYDRILSYGEQCYMGLTLVKNTMSLGNCVIPYDINFDLLTCIYGAGINETGLQIVSNIISDATLDYGAVIFDVPIKYLKTVENLIVGNCFVYCVNGSGKGYLNGYSAFSTSGIGNRERNYIYNNGSMLVNHIENGYKHDKAVDYVDYFIQIEDENILSINHLAGVDKVDMNYLTDLLR